VGWVQGKIGMRSNWCQNHAFHTAYHMATHPNGFYYILVEEKSWV